MGKYYDKNHIPHGFTVKNGLRICMYIAPGCYVAICMALNYTGEQVIKKMIHNYAKTIHA